MKLIVCEGVYDAKQSIAAEIVDLVCADEYEGKFRRARVESELEDEYAYVCGWVLGYKDTEDYWDWGAGVSFSVVPNGVKVWFEESEGFYRPARVVYSEEFGQARFTPYLICRDSDGFIYRKDITVGMNLIWERKDFRTTDVAALHVFDIPKFCIRPVGSFEDFTSASDVRVCRQDMTK